jgi:nickel superoxide dismutase
MRTAVMVICGLLLMVSQVLGHCQVPCGIYDDERRLDTIAEDLVTIEKAIRQVESLSEGSPPNYNQIVRWINVKEHHADDITDIVSWYFLQQRVKPVAVSDGEAYEAYVDQLTLLHEMMVYSMKVKQSLDLANVEKLKTTLAEFRQAYLGEEGHSH